MKKGILDYELYYFLGVGGIGMSALARYFIHYKKKVSGYDKTPTALTSSLEKEEIEIHFDENTEYLAHLLSEFPKENILVVYTPAVPKSHKEYEWLVKNGFTIKKRAEVLGEITKSFKTLAIAGTHGKTTTTTFLTHILKSAGFNINAFLGGISKNYNSNLILSQSNTAKETFVVVEADEYDRSFLTLYPFAAVITSVDADHLDIYGDKKAVEESYTAFAEQVNDNGHLIVKKNVDNTLSLKKKRHTYSVISDADFQAKNIRVDDAEFYFDLETPFGSLKNVHCGIPGQHNVENAVAASAICSLVGVPLDEIAKAISSFSGVKRRFDYRVKKKDLVYIDDYAHHPEELKASIGAAKSLYPGKKITGIFQPHLFSRTRDFADGFAEALDLLDECLLLPIYPARELPIEGVSSEMLLNKMKSANKKVIEKKNVIDYFKTNKAEVVLTLGAGDIDTLIEPLEKLFLS
jgi:UDP-N-acetylmuramate--alanine ligase